MSHIDRSIPNEAVIPTFETDLFAEQPNSRFAIGIIAVGDQITPGCEDEFQAYLQLRANVFAYQTNQLPHEVVRDDGTEMDHDDARAIHFGLFEQHELGARAVGSIRLIVKSPEDNSPLPIEEFFADTFKEEGEAPLYSTEASRLIARHENAGTQRHIKWSLFSGALAYIRAHGLGPTYATVEEAVEADFRAGRMPFMRIADPVYVEKYLAENLGIEIDTDGFVDVVNCVQPGMLDTLQANEGSFTYFGKQRAATPPLVGQEQLLAPALPAA